MISRPRKKLLSAGWPVSLRLKFDNRGTEGIMRIPNQQPAGGGRFGAAAIVIDWRQEWFSNICLSVILAVMLFLMLLSIYLVFSKPAPAAVPNSNQSGAVTGGSAFAVNNPDIEFDRGKAVTENNKSIRSFESINKLMA